MGIKNQSTAGIAFEVQTSAQNQTAGGVTEAVAEPVAIPPLPGGGSYTWSGTEWISNDPPADDPAADVPATTKE